LSLEDALSLLGLIAEKDPERFEPAAVRWHGRLETERGLSLSTAGIALAALRELAEGSPAAERVLRALL
jgi:hypothetical protein